MHNNIQQLIDQVSLELKNKPNDENLHHQLAILYLQTANFKTAQHHLEEVIAIAPKNIKALNDLAVILDIQGNKTEAKEIFEKLIILDPTYSDSYINLSKIYTDLNDLTKAEYFCKKALDCDAKNIRALNNLSSIYIKTNRQLQAIECIESALQINPNDFLLQFNYAKLLKYFCKFEIANQIFSALYTKNHTNAELLAEYADLQNCLGNPKKSMELLDLALQIDPNNYEANYYLCSYLYSVKNLEKAEYHCIKAIQAKNQSLQLLGMLANIQLSLAEFEESEQTKEEILTLFNSGSYYEPLNPFIAQMLFSDDKLLYKISKQWAKHFKDKCRSTPFKHKVRNKKKLRIGYISPDFGNHSVGLLIEDIFQYHDRKSFEIYGFPTKVHTCSRYKYITSQFDKTTILNIKNPIKAAKIIHDQRIDILVDLTGPTTDDNYEVLVLQPAPVQCQMVGFTGTLGADYVQYIITTTSIVSKENLSCLVETPVYMPECDIAHHGFVVPDLPKKNLPPKDKFVFLAHHAIYRINREILICWMQILDAVPKSILWLCCYNQTTQKNILKLAREHHIDDDRILFYENSNITLNWQHRVADLFLDTFTHTSGTLSFLCLWAGLPILTLYGNTFHSRHCASFCKAIGVPEQIVYSKEEYIQRAIYLAKNPHVLQDIKQSILSKRDTSVMFNVPIFVKHLESAFKLIWEDNYNGCKAKEIIVPK